MRKSIAALLSFGIATLVGLFATPPPAFAEQTMHPNARYFLPGSVEVEYFDNGGEGIAYHDSTPSNDAGVHSCRNEAVDVEKQPALQTCDVGWITPGEWLEYTLNVTRSDIAYTVRVHHASLGLGGTMHIEFDGIDVTGPIVLSDTGGRTVWGTTDITGVRLNAGEQVMRLVFDNGNAEGWLANIDRIEFIDPGEVGQQPFTTDRRSRLEAEDYDFGGEGVAYHDTTPENEPGQYRNDGVDIEVTQDEGGGYDIGWVRAGEWLEYSFRSGSSGAHTFFIRHASLGPGGTVHIEQDGRDLTGPIALPDTGGWQNWQTTRNWKRASIPIGPITIRLAFDRPGPEDWLANINYIDVRSGPDRLVGPPIPVEGTIQAESVDWGGEGLAYHDSTPNNEGGATAFDEGVDVEPTQDEGGGFDVGWITPGEWLIYTVVVNDPGTYTMEIRHAAQGPGGVMHVEFDGEDVTGPIHLPDTGGWQSWQTVTVPNVRLTREGYQWMRLVFDSGNAEGWLSNINWIRFTRTGS